MWFLGVICSTFLVLANVKPCEIDPGDRCMVQIQTLIEKPVIEPELIEVQDTQQDTEADSKENLPDETEEAAEADYFGNCWITHYCNCSQCCGSADQPTANGAIPCAGWTVANNALPFGTMAVINGHMYCVEDRGPSGYPDEWFDIYCDDHADALAYGDYYMDVYVITD